MAPGFAIDKTYPSERSSVLWEIEIKWNVRIPTWSSVLPFIMYSENYQ